MQRHANTYPISDHCSWQLEGAGGETTLDGAGDLTTSLLTPYRRIHVRLHVDTTYSAKVLYVVLYSSKGLHTTVRPAAVPSHVPRSPLKCQSSTSGTSPLPSSSPLSFVD